MPDMKVSNAIIELVGVMLPRFSPEHKGLHIVIDASHSVYSGSGDEEEDKNIRKEIHLLFHRPSNYTKVFVAAAEFTDARDLGLNGLDWEMVSDHDSCWVDGIESSLRKCEQEWDDSLDVDGSLIHKHYGFGIFQKPHFLDIDVVVDEKARKKRGGDGYKKLPIISGEWADGTVRNPAF